MDYNLLINGIYWEYNPLTIHLPTSWDLQACASLDNDLNSSSFRIPSDPIHGAGAVGGEKFVCSQFLGESTEVLVPCNVSGQIIIFHQPGFP